MLVVATASWYFIFMLFELFLLPGKGLLILTMWFVTWNNLWAYSNRVTFNILFILQLETHGSNLTEEQLETHTISAWKEAKRQTYARNEGSWRANHHLVHVSCPLCVCEPIANLYALTTNWDCCHQLLSIFTGQITLQWILEFMYCILRIIFYPLIYLHLTNCCQQLLCEYHITVFGTPWHTFLS